MISLAFLCLVGALCAFPPAALAQEETLYTIVDASGAAVTHFIGLPDKGDEYIARDNSYYVIISVDEAAKTALAERRGIYDMPSVDWLRDESQTRPASTDERAVALYCTHSDESYEPSDGSSSETPRGGIYDVAEALKANLEELGVTVHYDDATHLPHDNGAYKRSRATAQGLLQSGVDAIFDIHRDGIEDPGQYETKVDGQDSSMVRLLVGKSNQNAAQNKAFAAELKAVADELYPELVRDIYIGKGSYNQDLSANSVLLEFGTHTIDKELATNATQYMAQTIQNTLYGGVSGSARGGEAGAAPSKARGRGAWTGVLWVVVVVVAGACLFAILSTGGIKPALQKLGRGVREAGGGLFGKKNKK